MIEILLTFEIENLDASGKISGVFHVGKSPLLELCPNSGGGNI